MGHSMKALYLAAALAMSALPSHAALLTYEYVGLPLSIADDPTSVIDPLRITIVIDTDEVKGYRLSRMRWTQALNPRAQPYIASIVSNYFSGELPGNSLKVWMMFSGDFGVRTWDVGNADAAATYRGDRVGAYTSDKRGKWTLAAVEGVPPSPIPLPASGAALLGAVGLLGLFRRFRRG